MTIYDNSLTTYADLGSNYFLNETYINKITRADGCLEKLRELNSYVVVNVYKGELANNFNILKEYKVIVISEVISQREYETLNLFCRENKIGFIYCACLGLSGFSFTDFGEDFIIRDDNGEECKQYYIRSITKQNPGVVIIDDLVDNQKLELSDGDYVTFKELVGITELNESPPRPIKVLSPITFSIEDTTKCSDYVSGGVVERVKIPKPTFFKSIKERFDNIYNQDYLSYGNQVGKGYSIKNNKRREILHLSFLSIHEFLTRKNRLPYLNSEEDCNLIREFSKAIYTLAKDNNSDWATDLEEIEDEIIIQVARWSRAHLAPVCSYLGGLIYHEILKITSRYTPINQWHFFDFFECLQTEENLSFNDQDRLYDKKSRYQDQIAVFGKEIHQKISDLNVFLIGSGALGNEYLKLFGLMGIATNRDEENKKLPVITIADHDLIEVSNLNRQFLYRREDIGKSKAKRSKELLYQINEDVNCIDLQSKVCEETDHMFTDEFWEKQDVIFTAVDNIESRKYIGAKCNWLNKILIDSGTLGTKAHSQVIVPGVTASYNDTEDYSENIPVCTLSNFPTAIEHCIEWARDCFSGLFTHDIKELKALIDFENNISTNDILNTLETYTKNLTNTQKNIKLNNIKSLLECAASKDFKKCVQIAIQKFYENFNVNIKHLLEKYPTDHLNEDGSKFWSGAKRLPSPISLDLNIPQHLLYVASLSILLSKCLTVKPIEDFLAIKEIAVHLKPEISLVDKEEELIKLKKEIQVLVNSDIVVFKFEEIEFEKDDDSNHHVDFIYAAANLRAQNYKIKEVNFNFY